MDIKIQTIFLLPEKLKKDFKVLAAKEDRTMTEIGVELIQNYLEEKEPKN